MKTVLVSGGSGFLGGWCLVELLRRGYRVRTTVRDLAKEAEVRARVGSQVEADDRLTVLAADLRGDEGWGQAAAGCDYVLHVASPFPSTQPKDPDELIVPAREGTLRVLRAGLDAGVGRVVVTSSVAAVRGSVSEAAAPLTEAAWTDPDNLALTPYTRSKTIAERAAWDLVEERGETARLAVVNPGAILGPRIGGERFIAAARFQWMSDVAAVLRERLGPEAAKVPKRGIPDFVVRAMGVFNPEVRSVAGQLGERVELSSEKAETRLGWSPRPVEETIVDCARSLAVQPG